MNSCPQRKQRKTMLQPSNNQSSSLLKNATRTRGPHNNITQFLLYASLLILARGVANADDHVVGDHHEDPHPDPNEEDYSGMIYIGRKDDDGKRVGFHVDNG